MKITRKSMISGESHTLEVDCTPEQIAAWEAGMKIQDAMPNVSAPLREFVFGLAIVLFILFEPRGLAEVWRIVKSSFKLWPFSY